MHGCAGLWRSGGVRLRKAGAFVPGLGGRCAIVVGVCGRSARCPLVECGRALRLGCRPGSPVG